VADAVCTILPLDELDETTVNENTHPYDRLRAWIIKFILVIGEMYMDNEWFEKGKLFVNYIVKKLSKFDKKFDFRKSNYPNIKRVAKTFVYTTSNSFD
jgi:hypothetical protein